MTQKSDGGAKGALAFKLLIGLMVAGMCGTASWTAINTWENGKLLGVIAQRIDDRDKELTRIGNSQSAVFQELKLLRDADARMDTRVSIIETRLNNGKP